MRRYVKLGVRWGYAQISLLKAPLLGERSFSQTRSLALSLSLTTTDCVLSPSTIRASTVPDRDLDYDTPGSCSKAKGGWIGIAYRIVWQDEKRQVSVDRRQDWRDAMVSPRP